MQTYSQFFLASIASVVLLSSTGCSGSNSRPDLVPVKGRVTLDGKPLSKALVVFRSESGGRGSRSITAGDGSYDLVYLRGLEGAQLGTNTVTITTATEGQPMERVPRKYNKESTLIVEVPSPDGTIDFALTSK